MSKVEKESDPNGEIHKRNNKIVGLYSQLEVLQNQLFGLQKSYSYRIGAFITFPFRFLINLFGGKTPKKITRFIIPEADQIRQEYNVDINSSLANINNFIDLEIRKLLFDHSGPADFDFNSRKKVLFISPNLPDFDSSAGGKRAFNILKLLSEEFKVYCFTKGSAEEKYIHALNNAGIVYLPTSNPHKVKSRINHLWHMILMMVFWTIPAIFPLEYFTGYLEIFLHVNSVTGIIINVRNAILYDQQIDMYFFIHCWVFAILIYYIGKDLLQKHWIKSLELA